MLHLPGFIASSSRNFPGVCKPYNVFEMTGVTFWKLSSISLRWLGTTSTPHRGTYTRSDMRRGIRKETEAKTSSVFSTCNSPSCAGPHPLLNRLLYRWFHHFECDHFIHSIWPRMSRSAKIQPTQTRKPSHRQLVLVSDVSGKLVLNALISRHPFRIRARCSWCTGKSGRPARRVSRSLANGKGKRLAVWGGSFQS